jgi:hypothetical protein
MKNQIVLIAILFSSFTVFSQTSEEEFKPNGKPHFKVFWNYHTDLSKDASQTSAFELQRSYLGYNYNFSESISAKLTFDVGNNSAGTAYTAFLKIAQLDWKVSSGVKLSMGMIGLKQFKEQEDFWGYRYISKSFQDQYGFGSSADLGVNAEFKISDNLKANFTIFNGEGYKKVQDSDGKQKIGGSLIFAPVEGLTTKIYVDSQPAADSDAISALSFFAGYKGSDWRLGAEYNMLSNGEKYSKPAQDHNLDGLSFYATYAFDKKWEVFARYDQLSSNTLSGDTEAWNMSNDGIQIITGLQVAPVKGLKFSLNYQGYSFDDEALDNNSKVYINAEFKL